MTTTTTRNSLIKHVAADINFPYNTNTNMDTIDARIAKGNFAAATDPAVGDDSVDGYAVGSMWYNTTGHKLFTCEANGAGAASWRQIWPALLADQALAADWDAGNYEIRAKTFESDVATGTAPLTIASTTKVSNLNADKLDDQEGAYYAAAADVPKRETAKTTDPGVDDDSGDGYAIGSKWWNTTAHRLWEAESVGVGAAVWRQIWPGQSVYAYYTTNAEQAIGKNWGIATINFEDKVLDSHDAVTVGASWVFTAPVSGIYQISTSVMVTTAPTGTVVYTSAVSINGGEAEIELGRKEVTAANITINGTIMYYVTAGQTVSIKAGTSENADKYLISNGTLNWVSICLVGGQ